MKHTALAKIAALVTSVAIAGLYVAHRVASARDRDATNAPPTPVEAPAANGPGDVVPAPYELVPAPTRPTEFYGTKSAVFVRPADVETLKARLVAPPPKPSDPATQDAAK